MDRDALLLDWVSTVRAAGARGDLVRPGTDLVARWAERHRSYHDLRHLAEVLARVDELASHALHPVEVRLAAWFHDAVYEPRRDDNEQRSAELASEMLASLSLAPAAVADVRRLVLLTREHDPHRADRDGEVLSDADLAILAADPQRYDEYADDVRREYAHVPDAAFVAGRAGVLSGLLERTRLFRTPTAASWESRARANLRRELASLTSSGGPADRSR